MGFDNKILIYSNVRIEISCFGVGGGVAEYHAMIHVADAGGDFAKQLGDINAGYFYLMSNLGRSVNPVFRRYFLSDAANQQPLLEKNMKAYPPCAVSAVQQPPLDGSKVALWVYLMSDATVEGDAKCAVAEHNGYRHIWSADRTAQGADSATQTESILEQYAAELGEEGCTLADDCLRTWFFVQNVDVNYMGVVEARREFFLRHGLTENTHYITSTGIEGRCAHHSNCVLFDAYAVKGLEQGQQQFLYAPTHLNPTHEYGVTFERGVAVRYGDRRHIFIAGTASIDNLGEIVHPGDITGQTERMLENISALLAEAGADFDDIAQMIVYLRDASDYPAVNNIFRERFGHIPKVITLAPVCRPGWLIETECIAVTANSDPRFRAF